MSAEPHVHEWRRDTLVPTGGPWCKVGEPAGRIHLATAEYITSLEAIAQAAHTFDRFLKTNGFAMPLSIISAWDTVAATLVALDARDAAAAGKGEGV